ncbi:choice-of-anchor M domain-containing protein [uncultured Corynebacterium sp.]|uniref:choice-of-anchor M domain-containing protein n=1 Tax=uncultured Corynebacterium sp. TaxID=159447 RepID=UPI002610CFBF|nr:choice-of-anchor M domain-containing protein [uncultured Corynebacterium sp.]
MHKKDELFQQLAKRQQAELKLLKQLKHSQNRADRMMWAAKSTLAVLGVLVLTVVAGAWNAASPLTSDHRTAEVLQRAQATPTGHKPGTTSDGPTVGKDVKNPATGKTHVCAGRKLLYNAHVDAIYGTYNKGKPDVMVVDGQQPVPADGVCLRLAPDAIDGKEASRIKVPNKKALSFLGKPGTVLWHAPQNADFTNQWRPIWAGLGAFDPAHEIEVPKDFAEPNLHFHMKKFSGPGDMEVFFHNSGTPTPERVLSTKGGLKDYDYEVGGHGHFGWTFSKPGLYQLTMQWDVKKKDGSTVKSAARTINWLVGSDKQVGLPEGTTTGLNEIKKPIAPLEPGKPGDQDQPGEPEQPEQPEDPEQPGAPEQPEDPEQPGENETPGDEEDPSDGTDKPAPTCEAPEEISDDEVRSEVNDAFGEGQGTERAVIPKGHMDMGVGTSDESDADPHTFLKDGSDPANVQERESGSFIFLVNSPKAKVGVPQDYQEELGETAYALPQAQQENPNVPWLGFSTEHLNSAKQGVDVTIKDFEGPGRMVTLSDNGLGSVSLRLDSEHREHKVSYAVGAHDHQQFLFTKPGAYRVVFRYQGTAVDGKKFDKELETFFVIKDSCGDDTGSGKSGLEELQEFQKHLDSENAKLGKYMDEIVGGIEALRGNRKAQQNPSTGAAGGAGTGDSSAAGVASNNSAGKSSGAAPSGTSAASDNHGTASGAESTGAGSSGSAGSSSSDSSSGSADGAAVADGGEVEAEAEAVEGEAGGAGGIHRINAAQGQQNVDGAANTNDAQNVDTEKTAVESFIDSLTGGGWTTGFLLGLGLMGLLGGALLFFVAARNMQRAHTLQLLQAYREISRDRAEQAYAEGIADEEVWDGEESR